MTDFNKLLKENETISQWWDRYTSEFAGKFKNVNELIVVKKFDSEELSEIEHKIIQADFRLGKLYKRDEKYIIESEEQRFSQRLKAGKNSATIRFGRYKDSTNDFCLVGGAYYDSGKRFYLYYRSVELTIEFLFDLLMLNRLFLRVGCKVKRICVFFPRAFFSSRAGRLSYYYELKGILEGKGRTRKTVHRR